MRNKKIYLSFLFVLFCVFSLFFLNFSKKKEIIIANNGGFGNNLFNLKTNINDNNYNSLFNFVFNRIKANYVEDVNEKELYESAINGMLSSLDPHSSYLNKEEYEELKSGTKGEFGGIGVEITKEFFLIKVISPIEGTPAFKAGIKSGDYISQINGESVINLSLSECVKIMRGEAGTKVKLGVLRPGESKQLNFNITRENIAITATRSNTFNDIIYLKVNSFTEKAYQETLKNITEKIKKIGGEDKVKGVILDLRGNPGGLLDQSVKISELFLPYGTEIVSTKGKNDIVFESFKSNNKKPYLDGVPMVVLINEGSASASEIVAGALQDNKRAVVVGTRSFGKGSVQVVMGTPMGGAMKMTVARYYTPSGKSIQAKGIEPDIVVRQNKLNLEKQEDLFSLKEGDLKGHLKNDDDALNKKIKEIKANNISNFEDLYEKDYQLARSLDLLVGMSIFKK